MSLGAWLVSAPQMKSKSSNGLRRQDRSATPNLHDCARGSCSKGAGGALGQSQEPKSNRAGVFFLGRTGGVPRRETEEWDER